MNLSDAPDVLKVSEVSMCSRCERKSVYGAIERGELQAVRIGRTIRVTKVAMLRWLGLNEDLGPPPDREDPGGVAGVSRVQGRPEPSPSSYRDGTP